MLLNYLVALIVFSIVTVNSMPMSSSVDNGVNGKDLPFCTVCTSVLLDAETIGGVAATQLWVELEVDQRCNHLGIFASQCINAYTPEIMSQMLAAIIAHQDPNAACQRIKMC